MKVRVKLRVAGVDEAGRGPLAGPVVAAAVILNPARPIRGLADSKVLEPEDDEWPACRAAYLRRFPDAEHMTRFGDFRFIAIEVKGARHVAGFGVARSVDEAELRLAMAPEQ